MLQTYCKALWGATHRSGCLCPSWAWVSRSNQWLFSASCLLFLSLSLSLSEQTSVYWLRNRAVSVCESCSHTPCVCVWQCKREREIHSLSSHAPSPSLPFAPWLLLGACLCVCACACVCVTLLPRGKRLSPGRLSHSYVRIKQMHLHFQSVVDWKRAYLCYVSESRTRRGN